MSVRMCAAYKAYLRIPVGNKNKTWAPHFACEYCKKTLEGNIGNFTHLKEEYNSAKTAATFEVWTIRLGGHWKLPNYSFSYGPSRWIYHRNSQCEMGTLD